VTTRYALVAIAAAATALTCVTPNSEFACTTSDQCTVGGTCQPTGWCSFADATCPSGQRYSDAAGGGLAGVCVGDEPGPDADTTRCGNAMIDPGEDCEDGDNDATDGCVDCRFARCGDGAVRAGVEDCDDGNTADGDACNSICLDCTADQSVVWPTSGHCYMRFDAAMTWDAAAADCVARGGYLVSYSSLEENTFVQTMLTPSFFWIGLDDEDEGNFFWQDDELLGAFTNWEPGQPNGDTGANCVRQGMNGTWFDDTCTQTGGYLCERAAWTVDPATATAYLYVGGVAEVSHPAADTACTGRGAHLVSITSPEENSLVDAITGATSVWLGASDTATEGTYAWSTGEAFGFTAWATGEPDGAAAATEDCVAMRSDGWYDLACTGGGPQSNGYICEVEP
jgi:cysteine-rich repeat protein